MSIYQIYRNYILFINYTLVLVAADFVPLYRVATDPWKSLQILEKFLPFFQDLKSPWKQNRALKVLELKNFKQKILN